MNSETDGCVVSTTEKISVKGWGNVVWGRGRGLLLSEVELAPLVWEEVVVEEETAVGPV